MYSGSEIAEIGCEAGIGCDLYNGITFLAISIEKGHEDLLEWPVPQRYWSQCY